jgi:hypothetical protein
MRGVDGGHVSDVDALGHGQKDVPSNTRAGGGAIGGCAGGVGEMVEAAEGGLNNSNHDNQLGFIKGRIIKIMMMMMMSYNRK